MYLKIIFILYLLSDSLVSLNTVYVSQGECITDNTKIYKHYINKNSLKDLLTVIGVLHIFSP